MKIELPHVAKSTASCVGNWICTVQKKYCCVFTENGEARWIHIYFLDIFELGMYQFLLEKSLEQWEDESKEQNPGIIGEYSNNICL